MNILGSGLVPTFGAMKVVKSDLAIEWRMVIERHPIRKRRRNWTVKRAARPGILIVDALRTMYVHPDIYATWSAGMYRRGDWKCEMSK